MDAYKVITDKVIEMLENGIIPWKKGWIGGHGAVSHSTGKPYSFANQIMLMGKSGEYLTFNQCKAEGGRVKKGEHGHTIFSTNLLR